MQGLSLLIQMGMAILNGFGLTSMFQASIGASLFLITVGLTVYYLRK